MPRQSAVNLRDHTVTDMQSETASAGFISSAPRTAAPAFWRRAGTLTAAATVIAFSSAEIDQAQASTSNVLALTRPLESEEESELLLAPQFVASLSELERLQQLVDGWDGEESSALKPQVIERAIKFLKVLPSTTRAPEACALPDGSFQWVWDTESGYATVYFGPNHTASYYGTSGSSVAKGRLWLSDRALPQDLWDVIIQL